MAHQFVYRSALMVAGNGVVHRLPKPLYLVHPRVIDRLEKDFELWVLYQPALDRQALVDDVVVSDEHDAFSCSIHGESSGGVLGVQFLFRN